MIPKTIHQIWIGRFPIPHGVAEWGPMNPGWEHRLWREADIEPLVHRMCLTPFYQSWQGYRHEGAAKANIARYCILLAHGGVYLDADTVPLRPLDDRFTTPAFWAVWHDERQCPTRVANGMIGCTPSHPVMGACVERMQRMTRNDDSWRQTGPLFLSAVLADIGASNATIFPSRTFLPAKPTDDPATVYPESVATHSWFSTKKRAHG